MVTHVVGRDLVGIPLSKLTSGDINNLYSALEAEGLSPATIRLTHAVLRHAIGDAKLGRNVATDAKPPEAQRTRAQAW